MDAKKQIVDAGLLGKIGQVDICCFVHMQATGSPPLQPVPEFFDFEMWTGPAPLRPYVGLPHRGWWRAFMECGNGILGDKGVHMLDTARWRLGRGWPRRIRALLKLPPSRRPQYQSDLCRSGQAAGLPAHRPPGGRPRLTRPAQVGTARPRAPAKGFWVISLRFIIGKSPVSRPSTHRATANMPAIAHRGPRQARTKTILAFLLC